MAIYHPDGTPRYIQIRDGGETYGDRYTVWFTGRPKNALRGWVNWLALGESGGFVGSGETARGHLRSCPGGKRIKFSDLPAKGRTVVSREYAEWWGRDPAGNKVEPSR